MNKRAGGGGGEVTSFDCASFLPFVALFFLFSFQELQLFAFKGILPFLHRAAHILFVRKDDSEGSAGAAADANQNVNKRS